MASIRQRQGQRLPKSKQRQQRKRQKTRAKANRRHLRQIEEQTPTALR